MRGVDDWTALAAENAMLRELLAQAGIDAAEHKVAGELQRGLLEELHHRVKNTLATVQAIMSQSLRTAETLEQGRQAIESRLAALGRVHDLLLRTTWGGVKLAEILKTATEPFNTPAAPQVSIQSTDIEVDSGAALPLAMTLNELCTNAVKYGALSIPAGRVSITATVNEDAGQFRLEWVERDGPPVEEPKRRSFGTRLIEHSFVGQLQGAARLTFAPGGVVCQLDVPLAALRTLISN